MGNPAEDFARDFPGKCLICSLHQFGLRNVWIDPNDPVPEHDCCEGMDRWKRAEMGGGVLSSLFTDFRQDGWPYCPRCTNDELWSSVMMEWMGEEPRPTLAECFAGEFTCYACGWKSSARIEP